MSEQPILAVVDLTNMIHTDWRAVNGSGSGEAKDVTQYAIRRCRAMKETWRAKVICAIDSPDSFRRDKYPDYKAHRGPKPETLTRQMVVATHLLCKEFPVVDADGFEADDILATLAFLGTRNGYRVVLVTRDKDANQCLMQGEVTKCQRIGIQGKQIQSEWLTAGNLREQYGFGPERWIDFQCLVGDQTDGIVGCHGIGEESAKWLLCRAPLEDWLDEPHRAPKVSMRDSLAEFKNRYESVYDMVRLRIDVPGMEDCLL